MNHWLEKFAPFRYSWQDVLLNGKYGIYSVRNPRARNNPQAMGLRDEVLFNQSKEGNCAMGNMRVIQEAHQDPTIKDYFWASTTFEPIKSFDTPFPLGKIKQIPELHSIRLIK